MHEDLCTSLDLFNLATKCARAEEGRLSLLELPAADPEEKNPKAKDVKRKGAVVLAAEPDTKRGRDQPVPRAADTVCTTTSTPTTPTNVKSSELCEKEGSAVAPTAVTGVTVEEEEGTQDAGKTVARTKGGAINLTRIAGKTRLARETRGINLARIARKATQASLRCRHNQGEMRTTTRTRRLGASRSRARSPASWAGLKPQPLNASSSSSPAK